MCPCARPDIWAGPVLHESTCVRDMHIHSALDAAMHAARTSTEIVCEQAEMLDLNCAV